MTTFAKKKKKIPSVNTVSEILEGFVENVNNKFTCMRL